jgi:hypothetical protein
VGSGFEPQAPHLGKRHLLILFAYLVCERGIRSRKVTASPRHRNQIVVSARLGLVLSASVAARRSCGSDRVAIPGQVVAPSPVASGSAGGGRGWDETELFGQQQPVEHQVDRGVLAVAEAAPV